MPGDQSRVGRAAGELLDQDVEGAGAGHADYLRFVFRALVLCIDAELTKAVRPPDKDLCELYALLLGYFHYVLLLLRLLLEILDD